MEYAFRSLENNLTVLCGGGLVRFVISSQVDTMTKILTCEIFTFKSAVAGEIIVSLPNTATHMLPIKLLLDD